MNTTTKQLQNKWMLTNFKVETQIINRLNKIKYMFIQLDTDKVKRNNINYHEHNKMMINVIDKYRENAKQEIQQKYY